MSAVNDVIEIAKNELGYLEKENGSYLDEKTKNAGDNNFTKYARDIDATDINNGKKQGYAWCCVFVEWCFYKAFGIQNAKKLLCLPDKSYGAGVNYLKRYFANSGQLYDTPKKGDIVFFGLQHTGIVTDVVGTKFTTIEGNTSGGDNKVISNGGGVFQKSYINKTSYTFGRPNYSLVDSNEVDKKEEAPQFSFDMRYLSRKYNEGEYNDGVKSLQILLNGLGYDCGKVDGYFGLNTEKALNKFLNANKKTADGTVGKICMGLFFPNK